MATKKDSSDIMKGHKEDGRHSEGSTSHSGKIVRPSKTAKVTPAKYEADRKWNLGSNHAIKR